MELIESKFSGTRSRLEREDAEKRRVGEVGKLPQEAEDQEEAGEHFENFENIEESSVTIREEVADRSVMDVRDDSAPESASYEETAQAGSSENVAEKRFRPPGNSRKYVIPPRRSAFKKDVTSTNGVQNLSSSRQPAPDASSERPPGVGRGQGDQSRGQAPGNRPAIPTRPLIGPAQRVPGPTDRAAGTALDAADKPTIAMQHVPGPTDPARAETSRMPGYPVGMNGQPGPTDPARAETSRMPGYPVGTNGQPGPTDPARAETSRMPVQEVQTRPPAESAGADARERRRQIEELIRQSEETQTWKIPIPIIPPPKGVARFVNRSSAPLPAAPQERSPEEKEEKKKKSSRWRTFFLMMLLAIVIINASATGFSSFFGPQGWGSAFNDPGGSGYKIIQRLYHPVPGATGQATPTSLTPTQIVNQILANMTLTEKLGQMMMVQFNGQTYSPVLSSMISQYDVGAVIYYQYNIGSKSQLTSLNSQMQGAADLPMLISVDQEGGTVDRLVDLDGPQLSATAIGATGDPNRAYQQGVKDAQNLASYGFNLNLAPVVDVTNIYNPQLYQRTYGNNPALVTQMAGAYLQGLQKSGKVLGSLKHFPGLGDTSTDPHFGLPYLTRSLSQLNAVDWAPYRSLISQGDVYSILVTHEIVKALDSSEPSSLSPKVIGYLRKQLHFQGVIITDSLTMDSISNYYTPGEAAVKAIEAGDDILMGASSPSDLAQMFTGIKQAMSSGAISEQRINDSVRRILLFKYQMGLIHV